MADPITLDRLRRMTGVPESTWPDDLLEDYLELALLPDANGVEPDEADYIDTYDLHRAAALVFRDRAAQVADVAYDTQVDMTKRNASGLIANYIKMARFHEQHSTPIGGSVFASFSTYTTPESSDNISVDA